MLYNPLQWHFRRKGYLQKMSADGDPFFRLPTELCCAILRDWLLLHNVVRLDSAVCNTMKRPLLLNTIFSSSQCIVSPRFYKYKQRRVFNWCNERKVCTSGLMLKWEVDNGVLEYLRDYGNASIFKTAKLMLKTVGAWEILFPSLALI